MSAYRYWRLVISAWQDQYYCRIAEIELRATVGGADMTGSGTASASSVMSSPSMSADKAFDNNAGTYWSSTSGPTPHWIQYDFGTPTEVQEALMTGVSGYAPTYTYWAVSNDGQFWRAQDAAVWSGLSLTQSLSGTPIICRDLPFVMSRPVPGNHHYRIVTTVTRQGTPGKYSTRLIQRDSGALLRETKSRTDGVCTFNFLPLLTKGYQVIALDAPLGREDLLNASISDAITPEAMP